MIANKAATNPAAPDADARLACRENWDITILHME
jgi:hypothetical protein